MLTALVNFPLVALVLFAIVEAYNRLRREHADEAEPAPGSDADAEQLVLLREIRDALWVRAGSATSDEVPDRAARTATAAVADPDDPRR
ncbi:MscL family protein [Egicoccus halophilus]|uniref:Uncharacterized protein n=1 Tax=Egicoccus halophilus TaxID=1670830 RepID=A0A8J3ABB9_9ACTN|nr:MscL family protein [Egicoccus halophilus]GGI09503.1 hypothetical protein GCM10011354_34410 [Egicoccus halophilus]